MHLIVCPALAGTTAGAGPAYTDVTDPAVFVQYRAMMSSGSTLELNRHPAPAWADWDGDGDLDLPGYRNDGSVFVDVSEASGLLTWGHYRGAIWGDYDGDGDFDASVLAYSYEGQRDVLYRNDGDGTFTDVAPANGMDLAAQGETAAWADYDGDGDLDLAAPNYDGGALWRNDGEDRFTDVLAESGIDMAVTTGMDTCGGSATTRPEGLTWFDHDGDGWLDLYVAGRMWRNRGDGTFAEVTGAAGDLRRGHHDEAFAPADIDADGDLDLAIYYQYCLELVLLERVGQEYVERRSIPATYSLIGLRWADTDNDGDLDLLVPDYYPPYFDTWYRNDGDWQFEQVLDWRSDGTGASARWNGAISSFGDYDADGDLDLAVWKYDEPYDPLVQVRVLRNDLDPVGGWLRVRVLDEAGHPTQPGAMVRLADVDGERVQTRYVDGGTDWAVDAWDVHFGVDDAARYEIEVAFPRRSGEDPLTIGPGEVECLALVPGELGDRTVEVWRDGTVLIGGEPCGADETGTDETGTSETGTDDTHGGGDSEDDDSDDTDPDGQTTAAPSCGCGTRPGHAGWLVVVPFIAAARRRLRPRPPSIV